MCAQASRNSATLPELRIFKKGRTRLLLICTIQGKLFTAISSFLRGIFHSFPDVEETLDDIIKAAEDEDEDEDPAHDLFDNYPESDDEEDMVNCIKHTLVYLNSEGSSYPSNFPNFENKSNKDMV